ncbi:hypothetical protein FMN63_24990 [Stappia sp. BW2]|uniref:hypothetical protein n=1 Tax=Stappia sp. BW2 TaxID=2592622 RepID=UPI0011DEF766|nr:hypothetical protein [Stappia sp. BW2]TYC65642.1 hypothetical protein FMN63_24990 [Stappia sp. BW2]
MKEDRSWVLPVVYVACCGIIIIAASKILSAQDMFLGPSATALAGWLTLLVTIGGFSVTIYAVSLTAQQSAHTRKQTELQDLEIYTDRIGKLDNISSCISTSVNHARNIEYSLGDPTGVVIENHCEKFREAFVDNKNAMKADIHGDARIELEKYSDFMGAYADLIFELENIGTIFITEKRRTFFEMKIEKFNKFMSYARAYSEAIDNRKAKLLGKRRAISHKHYPD